MAKNANNSIQEYVKNSFVAFTTIVSYTNTGALSEHIKASDMIDSVGHSDVLTWKSVDGQLGLFNPLAGYYEVDPKTISNLLQFMAPNASPATINSVYNTLNIAAMGDPKSNVSSYKGSRYVLFADKVLDVQLWKPLELNDPVVTELAFVAKHRLNTKLDINAKLTKDQTKFLGSYSKNNLEVENYLMFLLGMALFPGHNFGANVSISGPSGSGKTILGERLLAGIYGSAKRVALVTYSKMNTNWPLNNFDSNTAVVWYKENNVDSPMLNDEWGTPFYDSFADGNLRVPVKGTDDIIVEQPMTLYVDGTQLIQSANMETGPARRTLPFVLPDDVSLGFNDPWRAQRFIYDYTRMIEDSPSFVHMEMMAFAVHILAGYRKFVEPWMGSSFDDVHTGDVRPLIKIHTPREVQSWMLTMVKQNDSISEWFESWIEPFISSDTMLHDKWLYVIYRKAMTQDLVPENRIMGLNRFSAELRQTITRLNYSITPQGHPEAHYGGTRYRKMLSGPDKLNFDFTSYEEYYDRPIELSPLSRGNGIAGLFGKKITGWYSLDR